MMQHSQPTDVVRAGLPMQIGIGLALIVFTYLHASLSGSYLLDSLGLVAGRDFFNIWHYGVAAFGNDPGAWYDLDAYNARLSSLIADYPGQNWSYPPHMILFAAPFGLLPYNAALLAMTGLSACAFWRVVVSDFEQTDQRRAMWATPAFLFTLICGQFAALVAALFILIWRNLDSRPVVAGMLIALLTLKPQIGFLFPIFLLATGRWRVFMAATVATCALIGLSVAVHGVGIWETFLFSQLGEQSTLLFESHPLTLGLMPSLAVALGMAGLPPSVAMALHWVAALSAIGAMVWIVRRCADPFLGYAVFIATSFVVTPYLMAYDTLVLCWLALAMVARFGATRWQAVTFRLLQAIIPLGVVLSLAAVPGVTLVLWAAFVWIASEASRRSRTTGDADGQIVTSQNACA